MLPIIHSWDEWAKFFTDVARWTPAVREICRRAGLPVRDVAAGFPGTNAVFVLDQTYVLKIYAPFCHRDFEIERVLYPLLSPVLPVPRVIAQGIFEDRRPWPYIVMNFLPGQPIREVRAQIPRNNLLEIASDLGRMVRALHQIPPEPLLASAGPLQSWEQFLKNRRKNLVDQNRREGALPLALLKDIPHFLTETLAATPPAANVLLNGDLTEDHILLEERDGVWCISGLIDLADSLIGPVDYEWVALWFSGLARDAGCLRAFMTTYAPELPLDAAFFRRALAFTFLHEFGATIISWVMGQIGNPQLASLDVLAAVLWGDGGSGRTHHRA
ncbi:MAG: aminoglycoside phosphotransferase family protein [Anaerolineae bacterium]|nr:aminoglycoside phosphotransferase family protein [Anaerolineae bacterium]